MAPRVRGMAVVDRFHARADIELLEADLLDAERCGPGDVGFQRCRAIDGSALQHADESQFEIWPMRAAGVPCAGDTRNVRPQAHESLADLVVMVVTRYGKNVE